MTKAEMATRVCPICDRSDAEPWLEVPDVVAEGTPHLLFRCRDCDYGFLDPRPTPEQVAGFYADDYYTHAAAETPAKPPRISFRERLLVHLAWRFDRGVPMSETLPRLCGDGVRGCDVGCGAGGLLDLARDAGADVVGVEVDEKARAVARGRGLRILAGTAESLPTELGPGTFDLLWMSHSLEHCIDPVAGLANVADLLKPSGLLMIEVPNNECAGLERSGIAWPWLDVPRHLNFFTRKSLADSCRRVGLEVERVEYVGYTRQFLPESIAAEAGLRDAFAKTAAGRGGGPSVGSSRSRWSLFAATAIAPPHQKYDSVRVTARRPS